MPATASRQQTRRPVRRAVRSAAPLPPSAHALLGTARADLVDAALAATAIERYAAAHRCALRAAAAVLAVRARPDSQRHRPRSAWVLLAQVAPELGEWAAFFASGAGKRAAAEAGLHSAATAREADDLLRDAEAFLALVATALGVDPALPRPAARAL